MATNTTNGSTANGSVTGTTVASTTVANGSTPNEVGRKEVVLDHTGFVGHGNTLAAWVCVGIMALGVAVAAVGFVTASTPVFIVGLGLIVVGLIAGGVLKAMGHGVQPGGESQKHDTDDRV